MHYMFQHPLELSVPRLHHIFRLLQAAKFLAIKDEADPDPDADPEQQQQQLVPHGQGGPPFRAPAGYLCPRCVQQAGDGCPLDLLQLHAAVLADMKPARPRSAADIYAAEVTRKVCAGVCGGAGGGALAVSS
jgi:hypothetical protein